MVEATAALRCDSSIKQVSVDAVVSPVGNVAAGSCWNSILWLCIVHWWVNQFCCCWA